MNDKKIISAIHSRDEEMLAFVVQKYAKLLWKTAASILIPAASVQDVEECIADVFIYLWQYPEKYDPGKAKLSTWLSMITRSKAIDRYRQVIKRRELSMEEIAAEGLEYLEAAMPDEEKESLLSCIEELAEQDKELLVRRYYDEQKPAEIAAALDMPKKQVENRLYYVRQKLKKGWETRKGDGGMETYSKKHLKNIQIRVQNETGVVLTGRRKFAEYKIRRMALLAACLLCFTILSAFAFVKFSDLNGDKVGFASAYQGNGRFEIVVVNSSDRVLELEDQIKVMQWSTGEEAEGDPGKIRMENRTVEAHSQSIVSIDLSEGYDVQAMEEKLQDGDWYYFVFTNHQFAFGQDWMCSFDFEKETAEAAAKRLALVSGQSPEEEDPAGQKGVEQQYDAGSLMDTDWIWPTVSQKISALYGRQDNGTNSDHINIAGTLGDDIYAVADGTVTKAAFDTVYGNVITVDLGEGISIQYGHLKEIKVAEGDEIQQGQVIASLGQSGMAAGPNLSFAVIVDGENVNPFREDSGGSQPQHGSGG